MNVNSLVDIQEIRQQINVKENLKTKTKTKVMKEILLVVIVPEREMATDMNKNFIDHEETTVNLLALKS